MNQKNVEREFYNNLSLKDDSNEEELEKDIVK